MPYNPQIHHRKSIRLKGYDYSQAGLYFITICCQDRKHRFGKITVGDGFTSSHRFGKIDIGDGFTPSQMILNEYGIIAYNEWAKLPERFPNFELDVFQIMPNHMHGIIMLNGGIPTVAQNDSDAHEDSVAQNNNNGNGAGVNIESGAGVNPAPTVSDIVGAYKSLVANCCLEIFKSKNEMMGKLWQRNYHEHIIRNQQSYQTISDYIINNPLKWKEDKFYK